MKYFLTSTDPFGATNFEKTLLKYWFEPKKDSLKIAPRFQILDHIVEGGRGTANQTFVSGIRKIIIKGDKVSIMWLKLSKDLACDNKLVNRK